MKALRRDGRRQVVRDVILWALLAISVAAMGPDPLRDPAAFAAVTVPRLALTGLAVLVGRPWPLAAVLLLLPLGPWHFTDALATSDVSWLHPAATGVKIFPFGPVSPFAIWYAYLAGRRPHRTWTLPASCAALITAVGVVLVITRDGGIGLWITMISGLIGTYLIPYLLGLLRRRLLHQRDQAKQAAEAQARLRERARIARDMHDSLGHELALIAVRAAGLELSPTLAPEHARAAGDLRAATADAIDRLHHIIGVLREDPDPTPAPPFSTRDDLGPPPRTRGREDSVSVPRGGDGPASGRATTEVVALVERARDSGMAITLRLEGPVPACAHAVVQEGLTNAAKHAPGASVEVTVAPHRVVVRNGPPAHAPFPTANGGLGLAGLRERLGPKGGTLHAGPADGGFELAADLP